MQRTDACDGDWEGGGWQLSCVGLSETVRNHQAMFLSALEHIEELDPAKTELVPDTSSRFIETRLLIEARLRQSAIQYRALVLGHQAVMDGMAFQREPARRVLQQLRPRLLIADTVGLGKTLEAGILTAELARRGRARRILVVSTKSMMKQFQHEFWNCFTIALTRLDSAGIQRIHRQIPSNHNPFNYFDRTIISVDTLKRDQQYRQFLEKAWWDLIIIDEAHNVSYKGSRTQSNRLARLLAQRSDALILLTATPHNGKKESVASLIDMLDPTVLVPGKDFSRDQIDHLLVRRSKRDVFSEMKMGFPERKVYKLTTDASAEENAAYELLAEIRQHDKQKAGAGDGTILFSTLLEKSLFSSPAACLQTLKERIGRLEKKTPEHPELPGLRQLQASVEAIRPEHVSKLQYLIRLLTGKTDPETSSGSGADAEIPDFQASLKDWQWNGKRADDRLVIFTERIETLRYLQKHLPPALGLKDDAVAVLEGQMNDADIQDIVESFGRHHSPLRLLIASDVASEGLNLHHEAHRLIHFDIPWSLMVFQQRNGRVDRYGQQKAPMIGYLYTRPGHEAIRGDARYLDILIEKDVQIARNIGDASALTGFVDPQEEEEAIAIGIQEGRDPNRILSTQQAGAAAEADVGEENIDAFDALFGESAPEDGSGADASSAAEASGADFDAMFASLNEPSDQAGTPAAARDVSSMPGASQPSANQTHKVDTAALPTLFDSHYQYLREGLGYLNSKASTEETLCHEDDPQRQSLAITPGPDLQQQLRRELAPEMYPEDGRFTLCAEKTLVQKAIKDARNGDGMPTVQYLWPLHPVLHWLDFKLMSLVGRQKAPVMRVPQGLAEGEAIFLILAQRPNRRGQTMQSNWLGVHMDQHGKLLDIMEGIEVVLKHTGLTGGNARTPANDGRPMDMASWQPLLAKALGEARKHLGQINETFDAHFKQRLYDETQKLAGLKASHEQQLQLQFGEESALPRLRQRQHDERVAEVHALFNQYERWAQETLQLDKQSQLMVLAMLVA
ncbi:MAG: DEAD/DEAH box helicase [Lautropia sp.]|nr:DEAD/DEAH box helicase [Lautropia sp.]